LEDYHFVEPIPPPAASLTQENDPFGFAKRKFEKLLDAHVKRQEEYNDNKPRVYAVIWGQCTVSLRHRLMEFDDYADFDISKDPLPLWKRIAQSCIDGSSKRENTTKKKMEARERFFRLRQGPLESVGDFYERFKSEAEFLEQSEAWFVPASKPLPDDPEVLAEYLKKLEEENDKELAMAFLLKLDRKRFKGLLDELENSLSSGRDEYPTTVVGAYTLDNTSQGGWSVGCFCIFQAISGAEQ
jgi:hypothetical protein